ncbi:hypothetical protein N7457_000143 [Penicillium paradoxum]|uniref:uncharacterized protein n=1 Tax=Penicillium paradoxum TaxID=176176 RepID=UPI0025478C55|nr:uncharacterized protein N7457_000143 [Penicillium paradoxum]KAJ5793544.1 hypothetical protein N7457_000143 [Penicillium paradoxum]
MGVSFQILSDLHLETHSSYGGFSFAQTASYLALLGDIGHVANNELFSFLEYQLSRYSIVFFLLGNHEPYHVSFKVAKSKMRSFQTSMDKRSQGKFVFLDQTRYDITRDLTVLGCTLFSRISPRQEFAVESRLVDFRDILRWTADDHNAEHESDLHWLNTQVSGIAKNEPQRRIVVFTHHSPTVDPRCSDPRHTGSEVSTGFATDLSSEECWTNSAVVAWGFGHTHFNCGFKDATGKELISNQKGYRLFPAKGFNPEKPFTIGEAG